MKNCENYLKEEFPSKEVDEKYGYDYASTFVKDIAEPGNIAKEMNIATLLKFIEPGKQEEILTQNEDFIKIASECVDNIHSGGISQVHYRKYSQCLDVKKAVVSPYLILDHYCMPEFARVKTE